MSGTFVPILSCNNMEYNKKYNSSYNNEVIAAVVITYKYYYM